MHRVGVILWCLVDVALLMKVSAFRLLPTATPSTPFSAPFPTFFSPSGPSSPAPSAIPASSVPSASPLSLHLVLASAASHAGERSRVIAKRSTRFYGSFYRLMQRHSRFLGQQAFVEKMFRLFDMNEDNLIERDEFRAIMQLLGLIHVSY